MPDSYAQAVRRLAATMPSVWKPEERIKRAQQIVSVDAQREVTNGVNQFALDAMPPTMRGDQAMPSNSAAMLPPSRFDNGEPAPRSRLPSSMVARELARRNGNGDNNANLLRGYGAGGGNNSHNGAADQPPTAEEVVSYVRDCLLALRDDEQEESVLLSGLANLLDQAFNSVASDQESPRLPNGGVAPSELYAPEQSNAGSGSPMSPAWSGVGQPPATDNARLGAGRRWGAADRRRAAMDSARRAQAAENFLQRYPMAAKISIW